MELRLSIGNLSTMSKLMLNSPVMEFQVWLIFQHTVWTINDVLSGYILCGPSMVRKTAALPKIHYPTSIRRGCRGAGYAHPMALSHLKISVITPLTSNRVSVKKTKSTLYFPQCYRQWVYKASLCITLRIKTWVVAYLEFIINLLRIKKTNKLYSTF